METRWDGRTRASLCGDGERGIITCAWSRSSADVTQATHLRGEGVHHCVRARRRGVHRPDVADATHQMSSASPMPSLRGTPHDHSGASSPSEPARRTCAAIASSECHVAAPPTHAVSP